MKHKAPPLSEMPGMWRRALIIHADGVRDATSQVRWLQARNLFVDLRQAAELPDFLTVRCLNDLSIEDCRQLALQEGFAGRFGFDGDCFEWLRLIDFQPKGRSADAGWLWWEEEVLKEAGRDVPYVEHWQRDPTVVTRPLAAVRLRDPQADTTAIAIQLGTVFMYARDRRIELPAATQLTECVAGAPSLAAAREMLDCEITLGSAGFGANVILASTHPWRVSEYFQIECADSTVTTRDVDPAGHPVLRRWEVIESEGDPGSVWRAV
jgi:hypothetical protein